MFNEIDDIHSRNDDVKSPNSRLSSASKKKQIDNQFSNEIHKLTNENHSVNHGEQTTNNNHSYSHFNLNDEQLSSDQQIILSTDFSNYLITFVK
jgi:hypothetical protein